MENVVEVLSAARHDVCKVFEIDGLTTLLVNKNLSDSLTLKNRSF